MNDTKQETIDHIAKVQEYMTLCENELHRRGHVHDASKLYEPELSGIAKLAEASRGLKYGSMAYRAASLPYKYVLEHHYAANDHHPQYARRTEEWKKVKGYEGIYEINNFGEIRSMERSVERDGGRGDLTVNGRIRKPHITPKGYLRLQLCKNNENKNRFIHDLVAETFIPNPENKSQVNHKNGNKQDNHVNNLEWSTGSENTKHAYENGLMNPTIKYVVTCEELDITTYGIDKMVNELRSRGYLSANSGAIFNCITEASHTHLGLTFSSCNVEEYVPLSDIRFMNLLQLIEMLCDWKAAGEREGGNIADSLRINVQRFEIDPQLENILRNTVKALGW